MAENPGILAFVTFWHLLSWLLIPLETLHLCIRDPEVNRIKENTRAGTKHHVGTTEFVIEYRQFRTGFLLTLTQKQILAYLASSITFYE